MPKFQILQEDEVKVILNKQNKKTGGGQREAKRQQYLEMMRDFKAGEWITTELEEGENKQTVRNNIARTATKMGYKVNFKRTRGSVLFELQAKE
jgi:hypothetical protein